MPKTCYAQSLTGREAKEVLKSLLKENPQLAAKAETLSRRVLEQVSVEKVAAQAYVGVGRRRGVAWRARELDC